MKEIIKGLYKLDANLNNYKIYAEMKPYIDLKYHQENHRAFCIQGTQKFDESQICQTQKSIEGESLTKPLCTNAPYTNQILENWNLYHARLMNRPPKTVYDYHTDPSPHRWAVHIPIYTNDNVFFVVDGVAAQMEDDGSIYFLDTHLMHTVFNGHLSEDRWHIVTKMKDVSKIIKKYEDT